MRQNQGRLDECIKACWDCRHVCQTTLYNHCLEKGSKHVEHVKVMADCIQSCQTCADSMTRHSEFHEEIL